MNYCEKILPTLYGLDLFYGKLDAKQGHNFSCFFIVECTFDNEFIKQQALQLLLAGCKEYNFYGKYKNEWHKEFEQTNYMLHLDKENNGFILVNSWTEIEKFVHVLEERVSLRTIVPHDEYLIYDDIKIYEKVVKLLKEKK